MTVPKFRVWDEVDRTMITTNDYEDLSDFFLSLDADDGFFSELMQSAGLFDANGREVFAGDIVLINRPPFDCQGVVKYYNGCWWIVCGWIAFSLYDEVEESLVIGNIYENKEMVENDEL